MDTTKRILIKAATWQLLGIFTMTALSYAFTGSIENSFSLAISSCLVSFVFFIMHEKCWGVISWGRND